MLTDCNLASAQTARETPGPRRVRFLPARRYFRATPLSRIFNPAGNEIIRTSETPSDSTRRALFSVKSGALISDIDVSPEGPDPGRLPFLWEGTPRSEDQRLSPASIPTTDSESPSRVADTVLTSPPTIHPATAEPIPTVDSHSHPADKGRPTTEQLEIELLSTSVPRPGATPEVSTIDSAETAGSDEVKTASLPVAAPLITLDTRIDAATVREWRTVAEAELTSAQLFAAAAENYDKALEYLTLLQASSEKSAMYRGNLDAIPDRLNELRSALAEKPAAPESLPLDPNVEILEQLLRDHEAQITASEKRLNEWDAADTQRKVRRPQMAATIATAEDDLQKARSSAEASPATNQPLHAARAVQVRQIVLTKLLEQQLEEYQAEQDWYKAAIDVLPLEQKLNRRNHQQLLKLVSNRSQV